MKLAKLRTFDEAHSGSFSTDGAWLALVDQDHTDIVEIADGRKITHVELLNTTFLGARISPDKRLLVTAYRVGDKGGQQSIKVTLWNTSGQEQISLAVVDHDWRRIVGDVSFSADSKLVVSNIGGIARLWDAATAKEVHRFSPSAEPAGIEAERALLSSDGRFLAVYFRLEDTRHPYHGINLWNLVTNKQTFLATRVYSDWAFSADSKLLALTAIVDKGKPTERSVAQIWEVQTAKLARSIEVPHGWEGAFAVGLSPDGKRVAIGGRGKFGIYSVETGALMVEGTHASRPFFTKRSELSYDLTHVEFSPDGTLLLTAGNDGTVKLWRVS